MSALTCYRQLKVTSGLHVTRPRLAGVLAFARSWALLVTPLIWTTESKTHLKRDNYAGLPNGFRLLGAPSYISASSYGVLHEEVTDSCLRVIRGQYPPRSKAPGGHRPATGRSRYGPEPCPMLDQRPATELLFCAARNSLVLFVDQVSRGGEPRKKWSGLAEDF